MPGGYLSGIWYGTLHAGMKPRAIDLVSAIAENGRNSRNCLTKTKSYNLRNERFFRFL